VNPKTNAVLENVIRVLKRHALFEGAGHVKIHDDGSGFYVYPPNPIDGQVYDSYLVGDNNGMTVQKLAKAALLQLRASGKQLSSSEVQDYVDDYVMKNGGKRARKVRWNSKSYPD